MAAGLVIESAVTKTTYVLCEVTNVVKMSAGDGKDEDDEEEIPEAKPAKGKRGQKKAVETPVDPEEEPQDTGESTTKRRRKPAEEKGN